MSYDREKAVQYANTWWDKGNPQYPYFDNDCANYVSQCLRAGGAPMWGAPNREQGWWMEGGNWSFSWSTAHSLRWYLASSTKGVTATIVSTPQQLRRIGRATHLLECRVPRRFCRCRC